MTQHLETTFVLAIMSAVFLSIMFGNLGNLIANWLSNVLGFAGFGLGLWLPYFARKRALAAAWELREHSGDRVFEMALESRRGNLFGGPEFEEIVGLILNALVALSVLLAWVTEKVAWYHVIPMAIGAIPVALAITIAYYVVAFFVLRAIWFVREGELLLFDPCMPIKWV